LGRRIKNGLRQDQAVGHNDSRIGVQCCEFGLRFGIAQRDRVAHLQPQRLSAGVYRAGPVLFPAAGRAWRLGVDTGDLVSSDMQRIQRAHRKIRCSHKDQTHVVSP